MEKMHFASLLFPTVLSIQKNQIQTETPYAIHASKVMEGTIIIIFSEIDDNSPYVADYRPSTGI